MAGEYPGTSVPYPEMALPDLRDPVLSGPGHRALEDAVGSYHQFARSLSDAGGAVRALLTTARVAHEGDAAEASQRALRTLSEPGDLGAEQSLRAARSLEDQGSYVARIRADMQAADPGSTLSGVDAVSASAISPITAPTVAAVAVVGYLERHAAREQAAEAATRYQDNTNWNLGAGFQAFPAPNGPNPDTSAGAPGGGGVPTVQIGPAAALGTTGAAGGAGGAGGGSASGPLPGGNNGGFPVGLVPTLPGGSAAGGAGSGGSGSGSAGSGTGGAGTGGAGTGSAGTGGVAPGGAGADRAGAGGAGTGMAGTGAAGTGGAATGSPTSTPGVSVGPGAVGSGIGLSPQSYRPGGGNRGGIEPGSGILAGAPPLPGNGVIAPGSDRRAPAWGSAVPDGQVDRAPLDRQPPQPGGPAGTAGRGTTPGATGMPFMGGAGGGGGSDREHPRPSWLVQDDPEAFWLSGLPPHSDPVITPNVDG